MKKTLLVIALIVCATVVSAQYRGFDIGIIPAGTTLVDGYPRSSYTTMYEWTNTASYKLPGFKIAYDTHRKGEFTTDALHEITYQPLLLHKKGTLSDGTVLDDAGYRASMFTYMYYFGWTILYGHRIQFPLYLGVGLGLYGASDNDDGLSFYGFFNLSAMGRVSFYVTNKISVYASYCYHWGYDVVTAKDDKDKGIEKGREERLYPEIGVAFRF